MKQNGLRPEAVSWYTGMLALTLIAVLFGLIFSEEGYNPARLHLGYAYITGIQFCLLTAFFPFLYENNREQNRSIWKLGYKFVQPVCLLVGAALPIYLAYFVIWGRVPASFGTILGVEVSWGIALAGLQQASVHTRPFPIRYFFRMMLFSGSVLLISILFLSVYVAYEQAVITTVFDKDIPLLFFINPLLVLGGLLYEPIGGNQLGSLPVIITCLFSVVFGTFFYFCAYVKQRATAGKERKYAAR
ncbi:hypothetical protein [Aneurinibacillus aneurinilyticus]|uniref:Uncharacterized protein n=1 Tax=Aneurinibacillus aneurinilyticus ATCC 12856 TaxID=649747 RepID=U1XZJ3_ANEAE|nr:hypothetical protein [Aneurinibacillus aneurinilyticus]ERI04166.1 hypothetical protein HMPREF0083_06168 [Aneurinibacillus aneurinilyticus ATCC 12856]MED0708287.1 hypothetical protein [Aneurinibacillus aneurinilyticus]MED0722125.1 hypothetical protein [Aneurinibacillus aneurinilyticus]MED0733407.1 hypothetical protein [Aneurinibacillus aneurinilyticus]MED0741339.1 hypothetical protein [Aneurinibacillus aneurinilyticus]